jgi:ketosteroid isomerase-like protein
MLYRSFVRKQALVGWRQLSEQRIEDTPLAEDIHFVFLGDDPLAADLHGVETVRAWFRREFFPRLPKLRFVVDETLVEGGPWSTRIATRYHTERDGCLVYRGVYFGRVVWGKVVEEIILPDTNALSNALEQAQKSEH